MWNLYAGCMPIRRDDPRPQYVQVAGDLQAAIEDGTYQPGDRLPSRRQLAKDYGIAPKTAQHALDHLRDQGLAIAQANSGVFVQEQPVKPDTGLQPRSVEETLADAMKQLEEANARLDRLEEAQALVPDPGPDLGPGPEPGPEAGLDV